MRLEYRVADKWNPYHEPLVDDEIPANIYEQRWSEELNRLPGRESWKFKFFLKFNIFTKNHPIPRWRHCTPMTEFFWKIVIFFSWDVTFFTDKMFLVFQTRCWANENLDPKSAKNSSIPGQVQKLKEEMKICVYVI